MSIMGNLYGFLGYYNHSRAKFDKAVDMYKKAENWDLQTKLPTVLWSVNA